MKNIISFLSILILLTSCAVDNNQVAVPVVPENKVLLLKVDYLTNTFEGGKEFTFANPTTTFTISNQYVSPSDFGSITLKYQELNEKLFGGTIIWNGTGTMNFPTNWVSANQFSSVPTFDFVNPINGFQNIFNPNNDTIDYAPIWASVQHLVKVREYLNSNPSATVKIFLYTPSVGIGNPADFDWIIFLKN